ncbi:hypothetical protein [Nonomuraea sp. NPDC049400]|uniref:hypothetical protein n=1 Tax=Nonomuraea sp. NPDC049400 TaxID=3364352 RepID=UPI0037A26EB9
MNEHAQTSNGFPDLMGTSEYEAPGGFLVLPLNWVRAMPATWQNALDLLLHEYRAAYAHTTRVTHTVQAWETRPLADCTATQLRSIGVTLIDAAGEASDETGPAHPDGPRTAYRGPDGSALEGRQPMRVPFDAPLEQDAQPYDGEPYITTAAVLKLTGRDYADDTNVHIQGQIVDLHRRSCGNEPHTYEFADVLLRDGSADLIVQILPLLYPQVADLVKLGERLIVTGTIDSHHKVPQLIAMQVRRQESNP